MIKKISRFISQFLIIFSVLISNVHANPLLILEGIGIGVQILEDVAGSINKKSKNKKKAQKKDKKNDLDKNENYYCLKNYDSTKVQISSFSFKDSSYDICIGDYDYKQTYRDLWYYKDDKLVEKEKINRIFNNSVDKKRIAYRFKITQLAKLEQTNTSDISIISKKYTDLHKCAQKKAKCNISVTIVPSELSTIELTKKQYKKLVGWSDLKIENFRKNNRCKIKNFNSCKWYQQGENIRFEIRKESGGKWILNGNLKDEQLLAGKVLRRNKVFYFNGFIDNKNQFYVKEILNKPKDKQTLLVKKDDTNTKKVVTENNAAYVAYVSHPYINKIFKSKISVQDALSQCFKNVTKLKPYNTANISYMDCKVTNANTTKIAKSNSKFNWFAVVKHPATDYEFIATKVSTKSDARSIALNKCYSFENKEFGILSSTKCYLHLVIDENINSQLAKNILDKQKNQKTLVVKSTSTNQKIKFDGVYKWNGEIVTKQIFCKNADSRNMKKYYPEKYEVMCGVSNLIARQFPKTDWEKWSEEQGFKDTITAKKIGRITITEGDEYEVTLFVPYGSSGSSSIAQSYCNEFGKTSSSNFKTGKFRIKYKGVKGTMLTYSCVGETGKTLIAKTTKPIKPSIDVSNNKPPKLIIKNEFNFNKANYEITGKFEDEADRIFIDIDGRIIEATGGKFTIKKFSPVNEKLKITAIDEWGSKSEIQIVSINIDIKDTNVAEKLDPLNPNKIRSRMSNNKVALIIGIENYSETPQASYANLDAKFFYEYSKKAFGVKPSNINLLIDEDATFVKTSKALTKWLNSKVKKNQSELIIFFAGHGLASSDGRELYLLPQDSDPDLLERTALSRTELFKEIIALKPKSVTMFLDTCFSGISRDEKTLLASARPIRILANEDESIPNNFTIFSASQLDQISSGLKDAEHGIFSYFLMKGLEGNADQNDDRKITNGELLAYMDDNISQKASELGRQQNPSLAGDPNKVLSTY